MSGRAERQRLEDILEAIAAIRLHEASRYDNASMIMAVDAVKYRLVSIGEAVGDVSQASRDRQPSIPWTRIKGMRNLLTHRYHDVDTSVVWQVVDTHLGPLELAVRELLEGRQDADPVKSECGSR